MIASASKNDPTSQSTGSLGLQFNPPSPPYISASTGRSEQEPICLPAYLLIIQWYCYFACFEQA